MSWARLAWKREATAVRVLRVMTGCALFLFASSRDARAQESTRTSTLGWTRDDGAEPCIGTIELAAKVEALLGRPVFVSAAKAEVSVEGRVIKATPSGFSATIAIADARGVSQGRRTIDTPDADCKGLAEPVALAIALMIDPNASLAPPEKVDPPPEKPPEVIVREKVVEREERVYVPTPPPVPAEPPAPPMVLHGYVGAVMALGLAPISGGFTTGITIAPESFVPLAGSLTLVLPNGKDLGGPTLEVTQFQAAGYICPLATRGEILFAELCAGGQFGFLVAEGDGFAREQSRIAPLLAPAIHGRFGARVMSPFAVSAGGTLGVPLLRQTFVYDDANGAKQEAFSPTPVSGQLDVTVGVVIP